MKFRKLFFVALLLAASIVGLYNSPKALAASCTWTGGGSDTKFSTVANWTNCGGQAPQNGDSLVFGSQTPSTYMPDNDLSGGVTFADISFYSGDFFIIGNGLNVSGNVLSFNTTSLNYIDAPLNMATDGATIDGGAGRMNVSTLSTAGQTKTSLVNLFARTASGNYYAGYGVTIGGTSAAGNFTVVSGGAMTLNAGPQAVSVTVANGGRLKGEGTTTGTVVIQQDGILSPGASPGCMAFGTVSISGIYEQQIGGASTVCTDYDQIVVSGTVNIPNGTLAPELINGFTPTAGQVFKIIDNQGVSPVFGAFKGLAEGATFSAGGYDFKISYVGGDGNDVTLTAVGPTPGSSGAASSGAPAPGSPKTGLVSVTTNPVTALVSTVGAALILVAIARRLRAARA